MVLFFLSPSKAYVGEESWKDGQPYYHFISDKFGIDQATVVQQLKNPDYKLGNLPHIDPIDSDTEEMMFRVVVVKIIVVVHSPTFYKKQ